MKNEKSFWNRLIEFVVRRRGPTLPARKPMDPGENDKLLVSVREEDPAWRVLMNYAYNHVENNLNVAFDPAVTADTRRDFNSRAAGVAAFITDVENNRARLREHLAKQQKADERKKA